MAKNAIALLQIPELPVILDLQTTYTIISSNSNESRKKKKSVKIQLGIIHTYFLLPSGLTLSQKEQKQLTSELLILPGRVPEY